MKGRFQVLGVEEVGEELLQITLFDSRPEAPCEAVVTLSTTGTELQEATVGIVAKSVVAAINSLVERSEPAGL